MYNNKRLKKIKISIISPEDILSFSKGEITNSETLDYNTLKPVEGGLLCEKIFGSYNNNSCSCGNLLNLNNKSSICKICKTDSLSFKLRRYNFGHFKLNGFFLNTLFYKTAPYYLSLILNIPLSKIENILYNNYYLVLFPYKNLKFNQVLSFKEYLYYFKKYNNNFFAETSFEAINYSLNYINLDKELFNLKKKILKIKNTNNSNYKKSIKRYKIIVFIIKNNLYLNNLILKIMPVLPAGLRPIIKLNNNKLASSDLNELYKKIFLRNNRLKEFKSICFSDFIINNEKKLVQNSINDLILGNNSKNIFSDNDKKYYNSILNNIKGKTGFFRKNLLGKRVDFSGRAVIVSGPELNINECSIPRVMALELFRPFIYNKLISKYSFSIKKAKYLVDSKCNLVYSVLNNILSNFYVLLNRAPTLHRLSIQSFKVYLNNDNVIKINPLVCSSFNADFDGDQMAVHIPISIESRNEFKNILLSSNNILSPSNGEITIIPSQDIILGIYYSTNILNNLENKKIFYNFNDVKFAYNSGFIKLNTEIFFFLKNLNSINYKKYSTTYGRLLIYNILPGVIDFSFINKTLKKNEITNIINYIYNNFGKNSVLNFSYKLMKLGFSFITKSGLSISIDDMLFYEKKNDIFNNYKKIITYYNIDYLNGYLNSFNRKKKIFDAWENAFNIIFNFTMEKFLNSKNNSFYFMIDSGARGSELQIKQLCCSRGFVSYKNSGYLDIPVLNSLRDGLSVLEYFFFSHISRRSLADTALKTSVAGYLTRKLVEVANNVIISEIDCGTLKGIFFKNLIYNGIVIENFYDRIYGRVLSDDVYLNGNIFYKRNTVLNSNCILNMKNNNINLVSIRSSITCELFEGVCSLCYGFDLSKNKLVSLGVAVGIIAAQSIGEPGTQLTMRTFHTSGVVEKKKKNSFLFSNVSGFIRYSFSLKYVINNNNNKIVTSNIGKIYIENDSNQILESFNIPYSSILYVDNNSYINLNALICKWDIDNKLIVSDRKGYVKFNNFLENINYIKKTDNISGKFIYEVINNNLSGYFFKICDDYNNCENKNSFSFFNIPVGSFLYFFDKDSINIGDIISKLPIFFDDSANITGGLPKIISLFEARVPENSAVLSEIDGIFFYNLKKKNNYLFVKNNLNVFKKKISSDKIFLVNEGSLVSKGDKLIDGDINPHDILNIYGVEGLLDFYLSEIKNIYYSQGVKINDKHIEVILKQMLNKVIITDNMGNDTYFKGEIFDKKEIININNNLLKNKLPLIKYNFFLYGITKSSLNSNSFLSAVSFQNTSRILSDSGIYNKIDDLKYLKSNIILGKIVPLGTGFYHKILKKNKKIY